MASLRPGHDLSLRTGLERRVWVKNSLEHPPQHTYLHSSPIVALSLTHTLRASNHVISVLLCAFPFTSFPSLLVVSTFSSSFSVFFLSFPLVSSLYTLVRSHVFISLCVSSLIVSLRFSCFFSLSSPSLHLIISLLACLPSSASVSHFISSISPASISSSLLSIFLPFLPT